MADELIRLDTTIVGINVLITKAETAEEANGLFKAKDVIYSQQRYFTDVQPVKRGRWEYSEKEYGECAWYFCSCCDEPAEQLYNDETLLSEFCPHCGARMDGDSE